MLNGDIKMRTIRRIDDFVFLHKLIDNYYFSYHHTIKDCYYLLPLNIIIINW